MGGRLIDYIAQGAAADIPLAADMPARIAVGSAAIYYETDTGNFRFFNAATIAWDTFVTQTNEAIQDMLSTFLVQGTNVTLTYDDVANTLTIDVTVPAGYTDEQAQDAVGALIAAGVDTGLALTYDDAGNFLSFSVNVAADTDIWGSTNDTKFITPKRLKDWRTPVALVDGATITIDGTTGVNFYVTLGGNRILANPTNFNPGQFGVIHVTQDGTGSRTFTYGSNWKFGSTSIAGNVLSVAAGATDAIHYYVRSDGTITCFVIQSLTTTPTRLKLDDLSNVNTSTPPTDGQVLTYDNATSKWKPVTPAAATATRVLANIGAMLALSGFTQDNTNADRTIAEVAGKAITCAAKNTVGATNVHGLRKAVPAGGTPYRVAIFVQSNNIGGLLYHGPAFGWSNGVAHKLVYDQGQAGEYAAWTNSTTRGGPSTLTPVPMKGSGYWIGLHDDGTNFLWEVSADGGTFHAIQSVARDGTYNQIYIGHFSFKSSTFATDGSTTILYYDPAGLTRTVN